MKTNPLFILALLCTLVQGAWAQTCVSSDQELRKLNFKPTQKGVYIHQGRKISIY